MQRDKAMAQGVAFLRRVQDNDGGFSGLASPDPHNFDKARRHPTVFFTALILECLADVVGTVQIRQRAAEFLLRHTSPEWSWNYWVRGAADKGWRNYPDDLDDTACALAALAHYDARLIDGAVLAAVARQLTRVEQAPGGPYRTWLVGPEAAPVWQDVDIAVNANIGYFLHTQDVHVPGLEAYLTKMILRDLLESPYYMGVAPIWYFLARWYDGPGVDALRRQVGTALTASHGGQDSSPSPLHLALLVTGAVRLKIPSKTIQHVVNRLTAGQRGEWPAAALYYEPPEDGVPHYAGSAALTTAFCLEALVAFELYEQGEQPVRTDTAEPPEPSVIPYMLRQAKVIPGADLRRRLRSQVRRLAQGDHDRQITAMATTVAVASNLQLSPRTLSHLNMGSVCGWLAYTIYDDLLDGDASAELLGVANVAVRQSWRNFAAALPRGADSSNEVERTFALIDSANTWEIDHARATVSDGRVRITRLPNYGLYDQLADRSWGHALAAVSVLRAGGYAEDSGEVESLQQFFRHFLIARQLNDDAHDWEDDLARGHLSAVVTLLLQDYGVKRGMDVLAVRDALRRHFWDHTIVRVTQLIEQQVAAARVALRQCRALHNPAALEEWVAALERSAQQALAGRDEAKAFIAAYTIPKG